MHRQTENIVIAREVTTQLILRLIARMYDSRVRADCQGHLTEMRDDPTYVPYGLTIEQMVFTTEGKKRV